MGIERAPRVDRLVRQQRQRNEGRDQQPRARIDVVPAELVDEAVQRLLIGEHGGGHHGEADGKLGMAEHHHRAQDEDDDGGDFGGEALSVLARARRDEIADGNKSAGDNKRGS